VRGRGGVALVMHESARLTIAAAVREPTPAELLLVVGPEGGITDEELAALRAAGAREVRLGPEVLRASTAAAVALGVLGVLTERWARTLGDEPLDALVRSSGPIV
jgi:16S rRNA (uracil1498-N3)-methyltransferase